MMWLLVSVLSLLCLLLPSSSSVAIERLLCCMFGSIEWMVAVLGRVGIGASRWRGRRRDKTPGHFLCNVVGVTVSAGFRRSL